MEVQVEYFMITRVVHRPASNRNPRLQTGIGVFETGETRVQLHISRTHWSYLERDRVDEGEGEVEMSICANWQLLRSHYREMSMLVQVKHFLLTHCRRMAFQ
jgi:hypothetical protein